MLSLAMDCGPCLNAKCLVLFVHLLATRFIILYQASVYFFQVSVFLDNLKKKNTQSAGELHMLLIKQNIASPFSVFLMCILL